MKKTIALLTALLMMFSFVACSSTTAASGSSAAGYEGSLTELVGKIYEKQPIDLRLTDATEINLSEGANPTYFFGLENADALEEGVFSEPMMTSMAYSLCVARVKDGQDVEAVKKTIFENVDTRKWICVEANQVRVASCGDVILLVMVDSFLDESWADGLVSAFETVTGGLTGETLKKG